MTTSWSGRRRSWPTAMRTQILRAHPTCQCPGCPACTPNGCDNPSTVADHKTPHAECLRAQIDPDTLDNAQGLCEGCHNHKTAREQAAGRHRLRGLRAPRQHPSQA